MVLLLAASTPFLVAADQQDLAAAKTALAALQVYVGEWRGVGQPRRGSTRGAWREQSAWTWKFTEDEALLSFKNSGAKYYPAGILRAGAKAGKFELVARTTSEQEVKYVGSLTENGKLVFVADAPPNGSPARITIRQVARGKRLLVLFERRTASDRYSRLAEVGYTRKGSNFGKGTSFVECVVTGGLGTIAVSFQGQTYYVCCGGCRDYFNENPAEVLAEYRERKAAEKAKQDPQ